MTFRLRNIAALLLLTLGLVACGGGTAAGSREDAAEDGRLALPTVTALVEDGRPLRVVATTSIIGDVVSQVGGDALALTVLMQPGQDPHSYQPAAADLTAAADADIIFVNGWQLEEALVHDLEAVGDAVIVPVSAGIEPRELEGNGRAHGSIDPHVWQDPANVMIWVDNVRQVLGAADPANSALYEANAAAYQQTLQALDAELREILSAIPPERRVLITNHDNLGYFAAAYGFEVAGTVIPSISTLAEPAAGALAQLVEVMRAEGICTLVVETTAGDQMARSLGRELTECDDVRLVALYSDALGPAGSGADSYTGMMLANARALAEGLR